VKPGPRRAVSLAALAALSAPALAGCTSPAADLGGLSTFQVQITKVNGKDPPAADAPLVANTGTTNEAWDYSIQAMDAFGNPVDFEGYARFRVEPGAVTTVKADNSIGRNILFKGGKSSGTVLVTAVYGPARLWVEDMGYVPVDPDKPPKCADGIDNDGDGRIDYPADPGCAFADDDTEEGGTSAAGVSPIVHYALPRIADVQGDTQTPYPFEGIQVNTGDPQYVIVTRVASDGFYVTDLKGPPNRSNSLYAFNFNTPAGMRVCDRLTYLSGTLSEFFGFTELGFPSYDVTFIKQGEGDCQVPEPTPLDVATQNDPIKMETLESSLVRIEGYTISDFFGSKPAINNVFKADQSNCDLNGDGQVDFSNKKESSCADACSSNVKCSEWTGYSARGNFKVYNGSAQIQINTQTVAGFDPTSFRGQPLKAVTGTLRNFSGGSLNWTIETRCPDDLVCSVSTACVPDTLPSTKACVRLRTTDDPDEATN
jgi:hypothetical protein